MPATTKQQKKLVRLISALSDMVESVEAANLIRSASEEVYLHLFTSMVVAYRRPFTENYGVGHIQCDYPDYLEDSDDADMPFRHRRLIDLRNKFLAHSSAEGTCVQIIPPGVPNPFGPPPQTAFDFNVGKWAFPDIRFAEWLRVVPETFKNRLRADIGRLLVESFGHDSRLDAPLRATKISNGPNKSPDENRAPACRSRNQRISLI
jgi:hypothetical protein